MPRTAATPVSLNGTKQPGMQILGAANVFDDTNDHEWDLAPGDMVAIRNATGSVANVVLQSVADGMNRSIPGGIAIPDGEWGFIGPLKLEGWLQADGKAYVDCDQAVEYFVLRA